MQRDMDKVKLTSLAIYNLPTTLAIHEPQINRCAPLAIALALVNAAFAVSTSLCHVSPPCRLLSMRFGACMSLRTPFDPATVGVWCEVLPAGVKWGVIWRLLSDRSC